MLDNIYDTWNDMISQISYSDDDSDDYEDSEYVRYIPPSSNIFVILYENIFCCR